MWAGKVPPNIFQAAIQLLGSPPQEVLFEQGQMVDGKVLKVLSASQVLVRLSGVELVAQTDSKLMEGQKIVGKVDKVEPRITVSLLKGESTRELKTTAMMRLLMPTKAPIGEAFSKIIATGRSGDLPAHIQKITSELAADLGKVIAADLENVKPDQIKEAIKRSGLFLEATLKEAAQSKASGLTIRAAVQSDIKAMVGRALVKVEAEINTLIKHIDGKMDEKNSKAPIGEPKTADAPARKNPQVYRPRRVTAQEPMIAPKISPEPSAQKPPPDPAMIELLKAREAAKQLRETYNNIELNQLLNASTREKKGEAAAGPQMMYQIPFFEGLNLQTAKVYIRPKNEGEGKAKGKKSDESRLVFMLDMSRIGPVRVDVNVGLKTITGSIYTLNDSVAKFLIDRLPELVKPLEEAGYSARFEVSSASEKFVTEELENYTPITSKGIVDVKA